MLPFHFKIKMYQLSWVIKEVLTVMLNQDKSLSAIQTLL
jgi:hypothetical protein